MVELSTNCLPAAPDAIVGYRWSDLASIGELQVSVAAQRNQTGAPY
jgi:hypothetical protein